MQKIDENLKILNTKTDRVISEVISIRTEVSTIKKKVYGDVSCTEYIVPYQPFTSMEQYDLFESKLEDEEIFKQFVSISQIY